MQHDSCFDFPQDFQFHLRLNTKLVQLSFFSNYCFLSASFKLNFLFLCIIHFTISGELLSFFMPLLLFSSCFSDAALAGFLPVFSLRYGCISASFLWNCVPISAARNLYPRLLLSGMWQKNA